MRKAFAVEVTIGTTGFKFYLCPDLSITQVLTRATLTSTEALAILEAARYSMSDQWSDLQHNSRNESKFKVVEFDLSETQEDLDCIELR